MASFLQSLFVRDVGALRQAAAERDVLARRLVERNQEIIGRDSGSRDHAIVHGLQQRQPLLLRAAGDEGDLEDDQVIRVVEPEERWRVEESAARQNVNDLEEVFRRNAQCAYEPILHRAGYFAETSLAVSSLEHVDFGDGHLRSPFVGIIEPSGDAMRAYLLFLNRWPTLARRRHRRTIPFP